MSGASGASCARPVGAEVVEPSGTPVVGAVFLDMAFVATTPLSVYANAPKSNAGTGVAVHDGRR